jgi:hypothetical protein
VDRRKARLAKSVAAKSINAVADNLVQAAGDKDK